MDIFFVKGKAKPKPDSNAGFIFSSVGEEIPKLAWKLILWLWANPGAPSKMKHNIMDIDLVLIFFIIHEFFYLVKFISRELVSPFPCSSLLTLYYKQF